METVIMRYWQEALVMLDKTSVCVCLSVCTHLAFIKSKQNKQQQLSVCLGWDRENRFKESQKWGSVKKKGEKRKRKEEKKKKKRVREH